MNFSRLKDSISFTLRFFSKPRFTGSIMPSSRFLGRAMVRAANLSRDKIAVELGPGTGPITRQILASGFPPENLYCVEFDKKMCEILKREFPSIRVINAGAENLSRLMEGEKRPVCAILSSLPLLSLPKDIVQKILGESESVLERGGRFAQFTYNLKRDPKCVGFSNMRHLGAEKVYLNVPPARVDSFEKI
ncbi:MAG: methyltransferase domain-containing protein [Opitutales bacterium]|nr:methyltransferase domain-containing protein [Opitutales bacterium]